MRNNALPVLRSVPLGTLREAECREKSKLQNSEPRRTATYFEFDTGSNFLPAHSAEREVCCSTCCGQ
eukprot:7049724-Alexandrium_andersonii.AAC.1